LDAVLSMGVYAVAGIIDPNRKTSDKVLGYPVLGDESALGRMFGKKGVPLLAIGIGTVKASVRRKEVFERLRNDFDIPVIVHKSAIVAKSARLGSGTQVMAGAVIQANCTVGENVIVNTAAVIEHDCYIEDHVHVSVGSVLAGGVRVGECSHIGIGAIVLQGLKIGRFVTVGAGAVVTRDVSDGCTVFGIPAREKSEQDIHSCGDRSQS
ncbi:MAG: acetyltransferase, partial [Candidatus Omnitrophica bacterium]|nr:acetyltransferase [Candidatus Omnitrophota bacterium]